MRGERAAAAFTLGCKVNQYETERLLETLASRGYKTVQFGGPADLYIVNTCTVTNAADKKSRQMIRRVKRSSPFARVGVCGCLSNLDADSARRAGADFVFDSRDAGSLLKNIDSFESAEQKTGGAGRVRAYVKIQDGCDNFCAYCVVPYARGPAKSRPQSEILSEAEALIKNGARELVLIGIHSASYGKDDGEMNFAALVDKTARLGGLMRLRLSSVDPRCACDAFIDVIKENENICGHFHLSLQSGCGRTLDAMRRGYSPEDYEAAAARLRGARDRVALTTDVMAGFPGETDGDFEESLRFVERMGFSKIHVFEFSARSGTAAAEMPDQIPARIKSERGARMRELAAEAEKNYLTKRIGSDAEVLFETRRGGYYYGHTRDYLLARVKDDGTRLRNETARVKITGLNENTLEGKLL